MPETIVLADGTEREIPTSDELAALQEKAGKADSLSTELETAKTEMEKLKEEGDPNWKAMRERIKTVEKERDELRSQIEKEGAAEGKKFSEEELNTLVSERAREVSVSVQLETHLDTKLSALGLDKETREAVKATYDIFASANKPTNASEVNAMLSKAVNAELGDAAGPTIKKITTGAAPRFDQQENKSNSFADTERGMQVGKDLGLSFANQKDA